MSWRTTAVRTATLALLAAPAAALGQQQVPPADTLPRYILEGVTVTSRRTPAIRQDLPQKVEVATRTDLQRTVGDGVTDALKEVLGLDVIQYPALLSGVSIRGFRPQFSGIGSRTLVLLDGRPAGVTNLSTLDLAAVERIEVMKGPASALYGSNAMGGVVNVVTRSTRGALTGRALGSYGSFGSYRGEAAFGGSLSPALDLDLTAAAVGRRRGYEIGGNRLLGGDSITKILRAGGTERVAEIAPDTSISFSSYASRSGSLRVGYALNDRWRVHARGSFFEAEDVQNPGDLVAGWGQTLNDLSRSTGEAGVAADLGRHSLTARAFVSREATSYFDDPLEPSYVSFRSPVSIRGAQLQDALALGAHTVTFGFDYTAARAESERFEAAGVSVPSYAPDSETRSAAGFAEARLALLDERLVATVGARLDRVAFEVDEGQIWDFASWGPARVAGNVETHRVFNPSAGLLYKLAAGIRLHGSGGRAFVNPDAFHVAGYSEVPAGDGGVYVTQGNPELDPESSASWDAGVGIFRPLLGVEADLTYFSTNVRNRIVARPVEVRGTLLTPSGDSILGIMSYANADEAEIRGIEGRVSYDLGARAGYAYSLRLFASGTRLLRSDEIVGDVRGPIRNVADLTIVGGLDYDAAGRFGGRLSGRYVGERLDTDFSDWMNPGDVRYPDFLVLDLSTRVRIAHRYRVAVEVDNLLDENYYEIRGYNLPGRSVRLGLGVDF